MIFAIGTLPPSACDESLDEDQLQIRLERYFRILISDHQLHPAIANAIVHFLSPSSDKPFTVFGSKEVALMHAVAMEKEEGEEFDIEDLFGAYQSQFNVEVLAPLSIEPDVEAWAGVFHHLEWEATELEDEGSICRPSYWISDRSLGDRGMLAYFIHGLPAPLFDGRISEVPTVALAQFACFGHYSSESNPRSLGFLLLSSRPQLLRRRSKFYCYIGKAYLAEEKRWLDLLISEKITDLKGLLRLNLKVKPGMVGAAGLAERTDEFCKQIALLLSGFDTDFDDPYDWNIVAMDTEEGWSVVTAVEVGEYEEVDLAPYLLEPVEDL